MFFVTVLPKDILLKLHLKPEIFEMININICHGWILDEVCKIQYNLRFHFLKFITSYNTASLQVSTN